MCRQDGLFVTLNILGKVTVLIIQNVLTFSVHIIAMSIFSIKTEETYRRSRMTV